MAKATKNQEGIVLLLSLIMIAVLFAIAITFAVFIISEIRQTRSINDSIIAYYAADSGLEQTLYYFRKLGKEKIGSFSGTYFNSSNSYSTDREMSSSSKAGQLVGSGSTWNITSSTDYELRILRQRLYDGDSLKLYFLNRSSTTVKSVQVFWHQGVGNTNLGVTFTQLTPQDDRGAQVYYTDDDQVLLEYSNTHGGYCFNFKDVDINGQPLSSDPDYFLNLKCLGETPASRIYSIDVYAYTNVGCQNTTTVTNLTIRSQGFHGQARQEIFANIPPRDPISGIMSFVLFSENDITKDWQ